MPFVAGEGDCPSTPSRPRGWRSSEQSGEPLRKKRTDQAQGLARKGKRRISSEKENRVQFWIARSDSKQRSSLLPVAGLGDCGMTFFLR